MYEEYYGLKAPPFNITPDPAYLFFSRRHRQAFEHILFGLRHRTDPQPGDDADSAHAIDPARARPR
jgi:hypothetical protein